MDKKWIKTIGKRKMIGKGGLENVVNEIIRH